MNQVALNHLGKDVLSSFSIVFSTALLESTDDIFVHLEAEQSIQGLSHRTLRDAKLNDFKDGECGYVAAIRGSIREFLWPRAKCPANRAPENLKLILHYASGDPRPAKSQIVEALRYFSKRLSCLSLATGTRTQWFADHYFANADGPFRSSRAFPLGSLQLGVGSDVDGVALVIPAGSLIDRFEAIDGTLESRPQGHFRIQVVSNHNF